MRKVQVQVRVRQPHTAAVLGSSGTMCNPVPYYSTRLSGLGWDRNQAFHRIPQNPSRRNRPLVIHTCATCVMKAARMLARVLVLVLVLVLVVVEAPSRSQSR